MAYDRYTWVDGELITAEKLNHIEDGIAEGGDTGYECTETTEQLFTETVTTVESEDGCFAELTYSEPIGADELAVVFNGTEYVCPKIVNDGIMYYGDFDLNTESPDFTNYPFGIVSEGYPFGIVSEGGVNFIYTESPMTVTVSASVTSPTVETTECFERAVKSACGRVLVVNAREISSTGILRLDKTWAEIQEAVVSHGVVVRTSLLGGNEIYAPVTVMVMAGLYRVLMLDGTAVTFTTSSVNGYPEYRKGSQT